MKFFPTTRRHIPDDSTVHKVNLGQATLVTRLHYVEVGEAKLPLARLWCIQYPLQYF
jgi:hypothetical protein